VIRLDLPALRERRDDIPLLLQHFVERFHRTGGPVPTLDQFFGPEAYETLLGYAWPGNVRELQNLIERLTILKSDGKIQRSDLPERVVHGAPVRRDSWTPPADIPSDGISLKDEVNAFEDRLIKRALEMAHGNKNRAAELLRMNRTTLIEKMKRKRLGPLNRRGDTEADLSEPA
jgi:two-component system response regulator PilR (NtrC family)